MTKNTSKKLSFQQLFDKYGKTSLKFLQNNLQYLNQLSKKFPKTIERIQLTILYYAAIADLINGTLPNLYGVSKSWLQNKLLYSILNTVFGRIGNFKIWTSPEKVFLCCYLIVEFLIRRPIINLSLLVKYHLLLVFFLFMLQALMILYWDLFSCRLMTELTRRLALDQKDFIYKNKTLNSFFYLGLFFIFLYLYCYLYSCAIQEKFGEIRFMEWLTDSVRIWTRIKPDFVLVGKQKKEKK